MLAKVQKMPVIIIYSSQVNYRTTYRMLHLQDDCHHYNQDMIS